MNLTSLRLSQKQLQRIESWRTGRAETRDEGPGRPARGLVLLVAWGWHAVVILVAAVAVGFDLLNTLVGALVEAFDSTVGWALSLLLAPFELLFSLPYLGRFLGWVWRIALTLIWLPLHLPELLFVPVGVLPEKRLRIWFQAPQVGLGGAERERLLDALAVARKILLSQANVRLVPVTPFQMDYPAAAPAREPQVSWLQDEAGAQPNGLAVGCGGQALREDLGKTGTTVGLLALRNHLRGSFRRLLGWGAPLMVLIVDSVDDGRLAGCSLGPLTDYLTLRRDQPLCLAHEIGHACNLPHLHEPMNLMNPTCGGIHLNRWQVALIRLSRHATYL